MLSILLARIVRGDNSLKEHEHFRNDQTVIWSKTVIESIFWGIQCNWGGQNSLFSGPLTFT